MRIRSQARKAFTLVEILIVVVILGILAAIVIPQFTNASTDAQVGNVRSQLQTIRSQVELFRVRNNGTMPAIEGAADASWADLIADPDGAGPERPYMQQRPLNPRNNNNGVTTGDAAAAAAADPAATAFGWMIDENGQVHAVGFNEATGRWFVPEE